ncbi:GAP family protein [Sinosporangium siamense]|uniref:Sap, sulfolipid-1-addressing protein n=1 Tax=Sinosporangium siamense TaxID=1367973 RepID=A0A919V5W5_9ACTN|nr:GAP family protein [Sinosporangium siamense]GII93450.1 hypothetical protein Ssi02_36810 [Sinosporangium siamense]
MTTALLLTLIALALVDSTSFGTLGIPVYMLVAGDRPRTSRLFVYLGTLTIFYFLVGVALLLGLSVFMENYGDLLRSPAAYWVQFAIGVGLFVLSFRFTPERLAKKGKPQRTFTPPVGGAKAMVLLALTAGLVEVATMAPYLAAIGMMRGASLTLTQSLPLLAAYVLLMIVPALLLMGLRGVAGVWLEPLLIKIRDWLAKNSVSMIGWALAIVGFLVARDALPYIIDQVAPNMLPELSPTSSPSR